MEDFLRECLVYVMVAGGIQAAGALILSVLFFPLALRVCSRPFPRLLRAYLSFNLYLLLWGCLGHYVFHCLTYGKLYVSADRVVDWYPFIPFGQWVLDQSLGLSRGYLLGDAALLQLRLIWFGIAAAVWLLAYVSTTRSLRRFDAPYKQQVA